MTHALRFFLALILATIFPEAMAETPVHWVQPDDVRIDRLAEGIRIELEMVTAVPLAIAWLVLTDFNNMARFLPNLESSQILAMRGNTLKIEQRGNARFGPFSQRFESVREVTLQPQREITVRQVSGTALRMESRMRLKAGEDGNARLEYRAEIVPDTPLPPLLGPAFVRHEIAEQFSAMIGEMIKRQSLAKAPATQTPPRPALPVPAAGSKGA